MCTSLPLLDVIHNSRGPVIFAIISSYLTLASLQPVDTATMGRCPPSYPASCVHSLASLMAACEHGSLDRMSRRRQDGSCQTRHWPKSASLPDSAREGHAVIDSKVPKDGKSLFDHNASILVSTPPRGPQRCTSGGWAMNSVARRPWAFSCAPLGEENRAVGSHSTHGAVLVTGNGVLGRIRR